MEVMVRLKHEHDDHVQMIPLIDASPHKHDSYRRAKRRELVMVRSMLQIPHLNTYFLDAHVIRKTYQKRGIVRVRLMLKQIATH
jgi:hypothetical protein